jgi:hypothetical protein
MIKALGASMLTAAGLVFKVAKADEPSVATTAALGRHSAGPDAPPVTFMFFETEEAAFVEAAVSRLISADE